MSSSSSFQRGDERRGRWGSPERTVVWTEPRPTPKPTRKVAVVYYLCRHDGHLDHPHFLEMELPLSSSSHRASGLYLRDFTARLDGLRGSGMPAMYAWSAKRSYRNGYVWQDLAEDDLVHPAHGSDEYVLKGSPLLLLPHHPAPAPRYDADASSPSSSSGRRRRNNWSSFDLGEHNHKLAAMRSAQNCAATQTNHLHHLRPDELQESTELAIDEISPPPSSSSPDAGGEREVGVIAGGRMRASAMLMQLFSCGSIGAARRGHARGRSSSDLLTSAGGSGRQAADKEADADASSAVGAECSSGGGGNGISAGVVNNNVMDRDYFSGSLVESGSKTSGGGGDAALLLKRSSSCNADRGAAKMKVPVGAREQVVRAGCLASRGSRAAKRNASKSTAAEVRAGDGGECTKGAAGELESMKHAS
ncbi:hypothetical protein HU200_011906 [Digitaria exilis]|uniref:SOSEKI DIX-like domain-containing protein n=1 Tax=Digitaria exilis TaxID=1010633 RepID=A0A835KQ88_9POAL|nr:hypothetical protein HU200_062740 [Digitaria exilis]KAF8752699.1 hypothetical protein HU200_011906 [Digitaria exilis]CAB3461822.1 unnamed protein product [Digitaria exilis]